jgi:hypothetical protein
MRVARGEDHYLGDCHMSEKTISRGGAFSLLGLVAALGFALPLEVLTESDAAGRAARRTAGRPVGRPAGRWNEGHQAA